MPPPYPAVELPSNPSLNLLGNLAKQLRKRHRSRDSSVYERIREHHPAHASTPVSGIGDAKFSLRDAQIVVAREHGFENWAALKHHIETLRSTLPGPEHSETANVHRVIPFFAVSDMTASLAHYVERLGFAMSNKWENDGRIAWCMLGHGSAALMLQQFRTEGRNARVFEGKRGVGSHFAYLSSETQDWPHHGHLEPIEDHDGYTVLASRGAFEPGGSDLSEVTAVLDVVNIEESTRFYIDRIGFRENDRWARNGATYRCRLRLDGVSLILNAMTDEERRSPATEKRGQGVGINYVCDDALAVHSAITSRGGSTQEPYVGNHLWNVQLTDPDGYRMDFYSPTDVAEGTSLSDLNEKGTRS